MRPAPLLSGLLLLTSFVRPSVAADIAPLPIVGHTGAPTIFSYFDHEGNSPFRGAARSRTTRDGDEVRFRFDMTAGDGAFCGWYVGAPGRSVNLEGRNVLRFELKGSRDIPTDRFMVGFLTANIPAGDNNAKVSLAELGYASFPESYVTVEIPLSTFLEREPSLDPARVANLLIVSIAEPARDLNNAQVSIRNARWTWDVERKNDAFVATLPMALFDADGVGLRAGIRAYLDRVMEVAKDAGNAAIRIEGHAADSGSLARDRQVSRDRARVVADFLRYEGTPAGRMITVGVGSDRPLAMAGTAAARALNNRVEIYIGRM